MRMLLQRGLLLPAAGAARPSVSAARPLVATAAAKAATAAPAAAAAPHPRPLHSIAATALAAAHTRGAVAWPAAARLVRCCSSGGDGGGESAASASGASTSAAAAAAADDSAGTEPDYLVINFYHLVDIPDTAEVRGRLLDRIAQAAAWRSPPACMRRMQNGSRMPMPRAHKRRPCPMQTATQRLADDGAPAEVFRG
jgi:hypothetical protein